MDIYNTLQKYFGYDEFKEGQKTLIDGVLNGSDALGIMPTGGGKSLCYQLPAMLLPGVTIVVSPLISLMKDQVDSLDQIGIPSTFLNSTLSNIEFNKTLQDIRDNKYKLIYVAPERLDTFAFVNLMNSIEVSMIAIDEAHCISQWGHDFRPSYTQIPGFINSIENRPIVAAYTATATERVTAEIKNLLQLNNPIESLIGFDRPNLFYSVVKIGDKLNFLKEFIENDYRDKSGIIYCSTRKTVESLADKLNSLGYSVKAYHGGMTPNQREEAQNDFILDRINIIVATNAFGMGIDKPDVRFVVHYNMPQNMESYYQEAGRAGRDGENSHCVLMYSPADIVQQKLLIQNQTFSSARESLLYENLQYLIDYCHTNDCLRVKILEYFDEDVHYEKCNNCSNCLDESEMIDITLDSQKILSCIYRVGERYGVNLVTQVLRGSRNKRVLESGLDKVSTYGIMKDHSNEGIREIIMTLISRDYIHMTADRYPTLKLTKNSREVLNGEIEIHHKKDLVLAKKHNRKSTTADDIIENLDEDLFNQLKDLRYNIASEKKVAPFMIFHDATLREMASLFPIDRQSLLRVKGVGDKKYESFGKDFIGLIKDYVESKDIEVPETEKITRESLDERYINTYEFYKKGLSLEDIAKERSFTVSTIINHLVKCKEEGYNVNFDQFIDEEKESNILEVINKNGLESLRVIKDALPEDYTYDHINLCIAKNELK